MSFVEILHDYGWTGVLLLFLLEKVWPRVFGLFARKQAAKLETELAEVKTQQALELENIRMDREARAAERQFRHEIDLRNAVSSEKVAEATLTQTKLLATQGEQLAAIMSNLNSLTTFMVQYTSDMRETVGRMTAQLDVNATDIRRIISSTTPPEAK